MNWKMISAIVVLFLLAVTACAPQAAPAKPSGTLTVMSAAAFMEPFQDIGRLFEEQHPGVKVEFNYAGSQQLAQQIAQGAPADVFASGNKTQMDVAVKTGRIGQNAAQIFASNHLVVIYPQDNPGKIASLQDLAKPGLKVDLAGKEAPAGQYALEFLEKASKDAKFGPTYKDDVIKNVVSYEENVKAVLTKISLGEADAGIVFVTDAAAAPPGSIGRLEIPEDLNVTASFLIATIQDSKNAELAGAFVDLVLSPAGQAILAKYRFMPAAK